MPRKLVKTLLRSLVRVQLMHAPTTLVSECQLVLPCTPLLFSGCANEDTSCVRGKV